MNLLEPLNLSIKKPLSIIFCLPGKSFSNNFLTSWSQLLIDLFKLGIKVQISQKYTSNVYYVRNMCLGGDIMKGTNQKPFDGKLNYNYIMWIDSDIVFTTKQFLTLLNHNKPIVSGLYLMDGGKKYATVKDFNLDFFKKNSYFEFLTPEYIQHWIHNNPTQKLMEVGYTGFGFILCKKGVFENIKYPWFSPVNIEITNNVSDFCSEDVSFCKKITQLGYKIYIDPTIIVGHEKTIIYR